ncbi:MAG: hypothetical protein LBL13_08910 [Bacteroidales bacterium]|nr:hypothetical protein [Bacteroidales bacterium]
MQAGGADQGENVLDCFVPRNDGGIVNVIASATKQSRIPARIDLQPYALLCFIVLDCFVPRNDDRVVLSVDE